MEVVCVLYHGFHVERPNHSISRNGEFRSWERPLLHIYAQIKTIGLSSRRALKAPPSALFNRHCLVFWPWAYAEWRRSGGGGGGLVGWVIGSLQSHIRLRYYRLPEYLMFQHRNTKQHPAMLTRLVLLVAMATAWDGRLKTNLEFDIRGELLWRHMHGHEALSVAVSVGRSWRYLCLFIAGGVQSWRCSSFCRKWRRRLKWFRLRWVSCCS